MTPTDLQPPHSSDPNTQVKDMRDPANHAQPSKPLTSIASPQPTPRPRYAQRSLIIGLLFAFCLVFWTIQLFIFMTALDAYLGGEYSLLWPSALSSLFLAALTLILVRMLPSEPKE